MQSGADGAPERLRAAGTSTVFRRFRSATATFLRNFAVAPAPTGGTANPPRPHLVCVE